MFKVTSPAFGEGQRIPDKYAKREAGGQNVSPPLQWSPPPEDARSLVLVLVDRHPAANNWIHWVVEKLPPTVTSLPEGASRHLGNGVRELRNTFGDVGYDGPKPPPRNGEHEYEFVLYALDEDVPLPEAPTMDDVEDAVFGHVRVSGSLTGTFAQ